MSTWKELYDDMLQELSLYQEEIKITPYQGMRYLTKGMAEFQRLTVVAEETKVIVTSGDLASTSTPYPVSNDILEIIEVFDSNGYTMLPVSYQQFNEIVDRTQAGVIGFNENPAHFSRVRKRPAVSDERWQLDEDRGMARVYTIYAEQLYRSPSTGAALGTAVVANGTNQLTSGNYYRLATGTVALNAGTYVGNHTVVAPSPAPTNLGAVPVGTVILVSTTFVPPNAAGVTWQPITLSNDAFFTMRYKPHFDQFSSASPQWTSWWANETTFETNFATLKPPSSLLKFASAFVSYAVGQYLRSQNVLAGQQPLWQQYDQEFRQYVEQAMLLQPTLVHELSSPYNISPYSN
jgi:hypothetical protein